MKEVYIYYRTSRNKGRGWFLFTTLEANTCKEALTLPMVKEEQKRRGGKWIASFVCFPSISTGKTGIRLRLN